MYTLKLKLILIFIALSLLIILIASAFLFSNVRFAIENEIKASQSIALTLVEEILTGMASTRSADADLLKLQHKFSHIRHIKVYVYNHEEKLVAAKNLNPNNEMQEEETEAPAWFQKFLWPNLKIKKIPIYSEKKELGQIHLVANPLDEINEIWRDIFILMKIAGISLISLILLFYLALGRALKPLDRISEGLHALKSKDYMFRVPPIHSRELAQIGRGFNDLASELEQNRQERKKLSKQLLSLQDQERSNIALELHDEFGPCLFGIKTNASLIENILEETNKREKMVKTKARSILNIVDHMESCNRDLLNRLRPMALGEIELSELIEKLVTHYAVQYEKIKWHFNIIENFPSLGETMDLTIYRVTQESLTNALRHSKANNIAITLKLEKKPNNIDNPRREKIETSLMLIISDDGIGFSQNSKTNRGIKGLHERVEALGGRFTISGNGTTGTTIIASLPLADIWE